MQHVPSQSAQLLQQELRLKMPGQRLRIRVMLPARAMSSLMFQKPAPGLSTLLKSLGMLPGPQEEHLLLSQ